MKAKKKKKEKFSPKGKMLRETPAMVERTQWEAVLCSRLCFTINTVNSWEEYCVNSDIQCRTTGRLNYFAETFLDKMFIGVIMVLL